MRWPWTIPQLSGGRPSRIRADHLITNWQGTLAGFDATQHQVTNFLVTLSGDEARCEACVRAHHNLEGAPGCGFWAVAGSYDYRLVRQEGVWRVLGTTTLTFKKLEGNSGLSDAARARVARGAAGAQAE